MGRYFEEIRLIVERHGGTVEKFIGDAVMAVFGIPVAHEDDALRAVRAVAEIRERLTALGEELSVALSFRTGVNTGEVVAGEGETLVTGDAVNVAARLEQAAAPGEILIGAETLSLVRDAVTVRARRAARAEGEARAGPRFPTAYCGPDGGCVRAASRRAARRTGARAAAAPGRLRGCRVGARLSPVHAARARRRRQVPARRGVSGERERDRRRSARPLPALRRGHHLLAARRDPARDRRRARRRDRHLAGRHAARLPEAARGAARPSGRRSSCSTTSSGPSPSSSI